VNAPRAAAALVFVAGTALAAPEKWVDPAPRLSVAAEGAPHLAFESEFVVGSGGGYALAFDARGDRMATGGAHGDIVLWDAASATPTARWRPYANAVESLAFSPDGRLLVSGALADSCDRPGEVMLWDVATRDRLAKFTGGSATAFAPGGAWFAYAFFHEIVLVDAKSLAEIRRFDAGDVERLAVSADGRRIGVGGGGVARTYDVEGKLLAEAALDHGEPVYGVGFLPDGTLVAASRKGSVRIGNVAANVPASVGALAVSPTGKLVAVGEISGRIHLLDLEGKEVRALQGPADWIGAIAFRPTTLDVAWIPDGGPVCVARGDAVATFSGNESEIRSVAFTKDGAFVAASGNETVFFDVATKTARTDAAKWFVATGSAPGEIVRVEALRVGRIDAASGRSTGDVALIRTTTEDELVYGLWPSPDGRRSIVSRWLASDLVEQAAESKPFGDFGRVFDGAWSADGRSFYGAILHAGMCGNGPRDPNVVVFVRFDRDGKVERKIPLAVDAQSLDLAPSGKVVALATSESVQFRDAATGELVESMPVKTEFWRFVSDDAALVGTTKGLALWRRGVEGLAPLVEGPRSATLSPTRDRVALEMGGRVFVYRIVR